MARTSSKPGSIRIGISGWTYPPWRGVFYPEGLAHRRELAWAASRFRSIEINATFYRLQKAESFVRWHDETPEDFVFSVKAPRYITHLRRLREIETPMANFLASGVLRLAAKLGPVLWQFPPWLPFDPDRFEPFFSLLPKDTERACELGRRHDARVAGGEALHVREHRPMRHAVEVRHESFRSPQFVEMLRRHDVALVCADTVSWPRLMDLTADFVYCRLHGSEQLYVSGYDDAALDLWASRVRAWARGDEPEDADRVLPPSRSRRAKRDVFVYFDNDVKVRAPTDAAALAQRLGVQPPAVDAAGHALHAAGEVMREARAAEPVEQAGRRATKRIASPERAPRAAPGLRAANSAPRMRWPTVQTSAAKRR